MSRTFRSDATVTEPEAARELFEQIGVRFCLDPSGSGFSFRERRIGDERLTVAELTMAGSFSSWGDTEVFGAVDVRAARYDWQTTAEAGTVGAPVLFRPGRPALVVAGALAATNVYLTPATVQDIADTVYGTEETVAFASSRPLSPRLGRYWSGLARQTRETVETGAFEYPLVRADLTRRLAVGMLECFPLTGDRQLRLLSMAAQARRYRIAVAFFDDHASLPVTVEDAARAADTTTTALVRAFRAHHPLGLTPTQYLRRSRLAAAHVDLVAGDPTAGDTVREIAHRWGFSHPGRFAASYRQVYGVTPRWTLQR